MFVSEWPILAQMRDIEMSQCEAVFFHRTLLVK